MSKKERELQAQTAGEDAQAERQKDAMERTGSLSDFEGFGPRSEGEVKVSSGGPSARCSDVTGLDCGFEARTDESPEGAAGATDVDQILANLITHITREHPDHTLDQQTRNRLRRDLEGAGTPR